MKRPLRIFLGVIGLAIMVGAGGWAWKTYGAPRAAVASFRTVKLERGDLTATISATGVTQPEEVIDVGAQVAAQIKHMGVDPNNPNASIDYRSVVYPGTLLAQLDDSLFKARVAQAQAAVDEADAQISQAEVGIVRAHADLQQYKAKLNQALSDWQRAVQLKQDRNIAELEFETAKANYETSKANLAVGDAMIAQAKVTKIQAEKAKGRTEATLREAQVNLSFTQIRSPVEGVILDRRVNVGQTVVAGVNAPSLFLIAKDLKKLQVWASVNEADIGKIRRGQDVTFSVDSFPGRTFVGNVAQIRLNANMTNNVVTYTVVVATDNSSGDLLPYLTANLQFQIEKRTQVLLVANAALRWKPKAAQIVPGSQTETLKESGDRGIVWVKQDTLVRPVSVRLGLTDGVQTEVLESDLQPDDQIVVGSQSSQSTSSGSNPFAPKMFGGGKKSS